MYKRELLHVGWKDQRPAHPIPSLLSSSPLTCPTPSSGAR